jgi:hypothetical protein
VLDRAERSRATSSAVCNLREGLTPGLADSISLRIALTMSIMLIAVATAASLLARFFSTVSAMAFALTRTGEQETTAPGR